VEVRGVNPPGEGWTAGNASVRGRVVIAVGIVIGTLLGISWWAFADEQPSHGSNLVINGGLFIDGSGPVEPSPTGSASGDSPSPSPSPSPSQPQPRPQPLPATRDDPAPPAKAAGPTAARTTAAPPANVAVRARYATRPGGVWTVGYVADIDVSNVSGAAQTFAVRLDFPAGVSVTSQVWNATADARTGVVTFRGGPVAPGQHVVFGFVAEKTQAATDPRQFEPKSCTVNGAACTR
jgi:hypothetical protein